MRASEFIKEDAAAVGKIATKKERNDPRYKTSLTVDVKPDTMKKAIAAYFPTAPLDNRQHQVHEEIRQQGVAEGLQPDSDLAVVGVKILNALKAKCEEIDRKYPHLWEKLTSDEWIGSGAAYQFVQDYIDVDKHTLKTFFSAWEDVGGDPFHDWPVFWREGQWDDFIAPWRQYAYDVLKSRGVDPKPPGNILMNGVAEGKIKLSTDPNWYGAEVGDYKASGPIVNIPANRLVGFEPDDKMNQPASKANVEKIVAGLKQGAKLPPLLVRQYKNGYQVLDGHHRFWAYKLLGVKSIPAQIVPAEDVEDTSKQGVAEGVNDYLWHGSKSEHKILYPRQAEDTGGAEGSNKNAVYATPNAKFAIAMGLATPGSDTGMFPNDSQMVLFSGKLRKGEMVYLHKVPKDFFIKHNGREWYSKPGVDEVKPIEVVAVSVDKWLHLIRQATPRDWKLRQHYLDKAKNKKQGVAEAREGAMREIIRKALPSWPDYVIKDWISSRIKNEKDLKDLTGWMGELNKMVVPNSWKLHQKMFLTFDMLNPQTRYFMKTKRQFGAKNPFLIPRDEERSANAEQLIRTQGMESLPPVIMLQHANGLALQEGWHRTMAAFRLHPEGFYINAWVGQATEKSMEENSNNPAAQDSTSPINGDEDIDETAAWKRKEGKNKNGGLNAKGVASYRREHPGSKLQTAVTTKPSKLKPGSKDAKRRKSFCARMSGVEGPMKKPNGEPTRKALALRKWNC